MTLRELIIQTMNEKGFDGLVNALEECGCEKDDLFPCDNMQPNCELGYKHMDPRPMWKGDWAIFTQKETPTLKQWEEHDTDY